VLGKVLPTRILQGFSGDLSGVPGSASPFLIFKQLLIFKQQSNAGSRRVSIRQLSTFVFQFTARGRLNPHRT
jgi:hypothetical protein